MNFQRSLIRFLIQVLGVTYNYNIIKLQTQGLLLFSFPAVIIDLRVVVCACTYKYNFQRTFWPLVFARNIPRNAVIYRLTGTRVICIS